MSTILTNEVIDERELNPVPEMYLDPVNNPIKTVLDGRYNSKDNLLKLEEVRLVESTITVGNTRVIEELEPNGRTRLVVTYQTFLSDGPFATYIVQEPQVMGSTFNFVISNSNASLTEFPIIFHIYSIGDVDT